MIPTAVPSPLHPDLLGLLASCRSAPADDTPRLVLADWLEEYADVSGLPSAEDARNRAALIRVQVELARPSFDAERVAHLRAVEAQLLAANGEKWLANGFTAARFARGLLVVELSESKLSDPEIGAWFASPLGPWVEVADVSLVSMDDLGSAFKVLDVLRPYVGLKLVLGSATPITDNRLRRLLKSKNFALVRDLTVYLPAIERGFLRMLPGANAASVRRLTINNGYIDDSDAAALASAVLPNLSALDVVGTHLSAAGMSLLANSPYFKQLTALVAYRTQIGDDGVIALAQSPLANTLNALEIQNAQIGDRGLAALVASPLFRRLSGPCLNLSMNLIGDGGAKALAECDHLSEFTELVLRDCRVRDAGAAALAESPHVANFTYLDLWKNGITDAGAFALAESPHLENLRHLSIHDNGIGPAGAKALRERFGARVKV